MVLWTGLETDSRRVYSRYNSELDLKVFGRQGEGLAAISAHQPKIALSLFGSSNGRNQIYLEDGVYSAAGLGVVAEERNVCMPER